VKESLKSISFKPESTRLCILSEGFTGTRHAKTATGVIRYGNWQIKSIIDSAYEKESLDNIPVVKDLEAALNLSELDALLIGIAPVGGQIPESWLEIIKAAIRNKIHIISGLHEFLNDIGDLKTLADEHGVALWDVRNPDLYSSSAIQSVAKQKERPENLKIISMVGSDCNVGKMCTALEISTELNKQGKKSNFLATGQTGIMISGSGVPLDRIIGDFMAGSIENEIHKIIQEENPEFIIVEGQGSLLHPGYSGVTLSLIHGSDPEYLVLCLKAGLKHIQGGYKVEIPSVQELIKIYESACNWIQGHKKKKAKIIGVSINSSELNELEAKKLISDLETELKIPVTDPIRFGVKELCQNLKN